MQTGFNGLTLEFSSFERGTSCGFRKRRNISSTLVLHSASDEVYLSEFQQTNLKKYV
jgi:hypothetical protein